MNVVGLTGFAGSGKSTVAEYLVEKHGYTRLSFAGPLKKMLRTLNPIIGNPPAFAGRDLYQPYFYLNDLFELVEKSLTQHGEPVSLAEVEIKKSSWGPEYRRLLQKLGTDCIRAHQPDFWVNAAVAQMTDEDGLYVFDDVRFPNEAEVIKDLNKWGLWNVDRADVLGNPDHESEKWAGKLGEWQTIFNIPDNFKHLHSAVDHALVLAFAETSSEAVAA